MLSNPSFKPALRPVEAFRLSESEGGGIVLRDRTALSSVMLTVSDGALQVISLMDGTRTVDQIRNDFQLACGQAVSMEHVQSVLEKLDESHLLEGERFEELYQQHVQAYRSEGKRVMLDPRSLGLDVDPAALFDGMLAEASPSHFDGLVVGVIAPHLDYPRGRPCYGSAYASLLDRPVPKRVVVLGTNHMGRATSVVGTASSFATPLGETRADVSLLERMEGRCGDLRVCELDHAREHSIELQVAWLQHLFGACNFEMLAFLCPDPCGPGGTASYDGQGVDLRDFAEALADEVAEDGVDTLIVAGADLSHVGSAFGDDPPLDDSFLARVHDRDQRALKCLLDGGAEPFRCSVAEDDNPTRVCSAGCIFVAATALGGASPTLLGYHQAVDQPTQTCVTCAALVYAR